jgi:hypothetical protein
MTAAQIEAMNLKNKAAHVRGAHQNDDNPAKSAHPSRDKARLAATRIRAARIEAILRAGVGSGYPDMPADPRIAPTPLESTNRAIPDGMVGPSRRRKAAQMLPRPTEHDEQAATVTWWNCWAQQHGYDPRLLFAVPNGAILGGDGRLRAIQMGRLKASGFRNGVPDLFLAVSRSRIDIGYQTAQAASSGLFIEMKRQGVKAAPIVQTDYHALLRAQGYSVEVCSGFEAARDVILHYLGLDATSR